MYQPFEPFGLAGLSDAVVTGRLTENRMSPCAPVPTRQRTDVHSEPLSVMLVAFSAVVGPLSGLPCWPQFVPPSIVREIKPVVPSTMHVVGFVHATPFRVAVTPLVWGDQVAPLSADLRIVPAAPAA